MKSAAFAAFVASVVIAAAGCGGDGESRSAGEWVEAFCGATGEWSDEIRRITEDVEDQSFASTEALANTVADLRASADAYVDELRELGVPDTGSAEQIEKSIGMLEEEVESETAEIEDALDDAAGLAGLATAGREIAFSVAAMFTVLERTFDTIENADVDGELEQAFADADPCDDLVT